ncbi:hypothetical protein [Saccharothrix sp. ALI-22-I]|uniref:hypothetical protein n=1 Tax=Saccharothrix sp. ALI-22-I TaxID=1933778 RepID=UPI00117A1B60|nr:hypothetical protein [Saccharothrix sp. ALI-22-I]
MRLPFGVHSTVRAEFENRWSRVRRLILLGFLGPPPVSLAVALVALVTGWSGVVVLGLIILVIGVAVPVWFVFRRVYLHRTGWWIGLVAYSGTAQALGIWLLTLNPLFVLPTVAAAAGAVRLVVKAKGVLLDVAGGAIAGTTLGVRSASRQVRSAAGHLLLAHASFDGDLLRWHVSTGPSNPDSFGGEVPLREITGVWVAETRGAPGGQVVVVRTAERDVELVVGHPHDFATILDRRLRLLSQSGWT